MSQWVALRQRWGNSMNPRDSIAHSASVDRQMVAIAERQRETVRRKLLEARESRLRTYRRDLVNKVDQLRRGNGKPGGKRDTSLRAVKQVRELLQTVKQQKQLSAEMRTPAHTFISEFGRFERNGGEVTIALAIAATKLIEIFLKCYGPGDERRNRAERRSGAA